MSVTRADFRFAPPSYRVIRRVCPTDDDLEKLESDIRRRDKYDLQHVTQAGDTYTLFFRLKEEYRKQGEHLAGQNGEGKTHVTQD